MKTNNELVQSLSVLLADTFTLYLKTHKYHWNVEGIEFASLHSLFETFYDATWEATDTIAERIRALGHYAPGSYVEFAKLTTIQELQGQLSVKQMVEDLLAGQEAVVKSAMAVIQLCEACDDPVTEDLMIQRIDEHQKNAWMLRSLLK